jgi:hypothetical protein
LIKIQKFFEQNVISRLASWQEKLSDNGLHGFETELSTQLSALHDQVCKVVLPAAAAQMYKELAVGAKESGCRKIIAQPCSIILLYTKEKSTRIISKIKPTIYWP